MTLRIAAVPIAAMPIAAIALIAAVAAPLLPSAPAMAAEGDVTWSVQPSSPQGPDGRTRFDYQVAPGSTITDWVAVTNHSSTAATFRVYGADARTDYDSAEFTLIGADEASTDLGGWTAIDGGPSTCSDTDDDAEASCATALGASVTLEAGARADVPFTIAVPHDATPGDHAAGIVASFASEAAAGGGASVRREDRVGARIYLRVDGALSPGLGVTGLVSGYDGTWNPVAAGTGRVGFDVVNLGNVRLSAAPHLELTGPFGIPLGTVALDPVANIMPGGTAHVSAELPDVPPLLLLFADVTVAPVPADGVAAGDTGPQPVAVSTLAWAVPWIQLGILVLFAASVWAALAWRRRSRSRLSEELAAYADRVRAEALADPAPSASRPHASTRIAETESIR